MKMFARLKVSYDELRRKLASQAKMMQPCCEIDFFFGAKSPEADVRKRQLVTNIARDHCDTLLHYLSVVGLFPIVQNGGICHSP